MNLTNEQLPGVPERIGVWIDGGPILSQSHFEAMLTAWRAFFKNTELYVVFPDGRKVRVL